MNLWKTIFAFLVFLFSSSAFSKVVGLSMWQVPSGPILTFPTVEGESQQAILARWEESFKNSTSYASLLKEVFPRDLYQLQDMGGVVALSVANNVSTMSNHLGDPYLHLDRAFKPYGVQAHVLPLGVDLILNQDEMKEFYNFLVSRYNSLLLAGGADVDPVFYQQPNLYSVGMNTTRDLREIQLLRHWWAHSNKAVVGVCRGMQLFAAAMGGELIQDLHMQRPYLQTAHRSPRRSYIDHSMDIKVDSKLFQWLKKTQAVMPSSHHQAVVPESVDFGVVVASTESIPEVIELGDRGVLVQFHPEVSKIEDGKVVMRYLSEILKRAPTSL